MSDIIKLNVINNTADIDAADLVICQHNAKAGMRANPIAWQVLRNIEQREGRCFDLPADFDVCAHDTLGNGTPHVPAKLTQTFELRRELGGISLQRVKAASTDNTGIVVRNTWEKGAATASVFKSGRLLATHAGIEAGQSVAFQFLPHVYVGLAGNIAEGQLLSDATASRITTRINLFGVSSADIVMTSSNRGAAQPQFRLENIQ